MNYDLFVKKRNKNLIIFIIIMLSSIIPFTFGGVLIDEDPNSVLAIILLILASLIFVGSLIWICVSAGKLNKSINNLKYQMELERITNKEGKKIFNTLKGEEVEFCEEYFTIDGKIKYYKDYEFVAGFDPNKGNLIPCIVFYSNESSEPYTIHLDGDLLDEIALNNISILNKEELDFYINNIETAYKQASKAYSFNPMLFIFMEFKKNKVDAKKFRNRNLIYIILCLISIIFVIGFNVLIIWLFDSEEGISFSNKIGIDIIIKIIFSIILIVLMFKKASKFKLVSRASIALYLILYWLGIFCLPGKVNLTIEILFSIIFIVVGTYEYINSKNNEKKEMFNRFYGIASFIFLILFYNIFNFTFVNEGQPWLISLYVEIIFLLITIGLVLLYLRKQKEISKKDKTNIWISSLCFAVFLGYIIIAAYVINLNHALDMDPPIVNSYEIINLENGDDNESDSAVVTIDGKEVSIAISDEEYHELKVGDKLEVHLYSGAFNMPYYVHPSK